MQQRVAQSIGQLGRLPGEVVVVASQYREFGEGLVVAADAAQGVGHGARGVGDDVGVAGISLGLTRVQVSDSAHRQPGQVGHLDTELASDRDRERADRSGLVDHDQHPAVLGKATACSRLPAASRAQA
jgi:hypothetical protein